MRKRGRPQGSRYGFSARDKIIDMVRREGKLHWNNKTIAMLFSISPSYASTLLNDLEKAGLIQVKDVDRDPFFYVWAGGSISCSNCRQLERQKKDLERKLFEADKKIVELTRELKEKASEIVGLGFRSMDAVVKANGH